MLAFAAKFMNGKDKDDAAARNLIEGLDGIYVRDYEFDKEGQYSMDELKQLRASTSNRRSGRPSCTRANGSSGETTDVMVKMVNGESRGMFILSAEPKELTIVLILGPIRMDQLGELKGLGGLGALGNIRKGHAGQEEGRQPMMKLLWIPVCCVALVVPIVVLAGGGQVGFDGVVTLSRAVTTSMPRAFPSSASSAWSPARPPTRASATCMLPSSTTSPHPSTATN